MKEVLKTTAESVFSLIYFKNDYDKACKNMLKFPFLKGITRFKRVIKLVVEDSGKCRVVNNIDNIQSGDALDKCTLSVD